MVLLVTLLLLLVHETLTTTGRVQKPLPNILPYNQLVVTNLEKGEGRLLYLLDLVSEVHPLSVTVTPCSASVQWSVLYRNDPGIVNDSEILRMAENGGPPTYRGDGMFTFKKSSATPGLYLVPIWASSGPTAVQLFVSLDPGGPHDLVHLQDPELKLVPLRRRQLSIKWQPSAVNPQHMHYCVVVSRNRLYSKYCEAEELTRVGGTNATDDPTMVCVQKKNHALLHHLEKGKTYFVSLFATNTVSHLTVPYGNGSVVIAPRVKPLPLKDGQAKAINLRKHQGRVNFRFRVAETGKDVHMYVIACGGSVTVQLMHRRHILKSRRVTGYEKFVVPQPRKGEYYSLKVFAADADQLAAIRSVEAFATQYRSRFSLPNMPSITDVHEYISRRKCSSVTVGWVPAPGTRALYCVLVRRTPSHTFMSPPPLIPDQCGLEARHRRSSYVTRDCAFLTAGVTESVTEHNVTNLSPGTGYSIRVTVKKPNGRTLAYKTLNVFTKHSCD